MQLPILNLNEMLAVGISFRYQLQDLSSRSSAMVEHSPQNWEVVGSNLQMPGERHFSVPTIPVVRNRKGTSERANTTVFLFEKWSFSFAVDGSICSELAENRFQGSK